MYHCTNVLGRLGRDPELSYGKTGKAICKTSVAVSFKMKDKEYTTWYNVVAFDKTGETIAQYFSKGNMIFISGKMQFNSFEDKDNIKKLSANLIVDHFSFVEGGGGKGKNTTEQVKEKVVPPKKVPDENDGFLDDDLPF
jgi:single-strand DNA-binding protein